MSASTSRCSATLRGAADAAVEPGAHVPAVLRDRRQFDRVHLEPGRRCERRHRHGCLAASASTSAGTCWPRRRPGTSPCGSRTSRPRPADRRAGLLVVPVGLPVVDDRFAVDEEPEAVVSDGVEGVVTGLRHLDLPGPAGGGVLPSWPVSSWKVPVSPEKLICWSSRVPPSCAKSHVAGLRTPAPVRPLPAERCSSSAGRPWPRCRPAGCLLALVFLQGALSFAPHSPIARVLYEAGAADPPWAACTRPRSTPAPRSARSSRRSPRHLPRRSRAPVGQCPARRDRAAPRLSLPQRARRRSRD
ncbi:hypothetical protein STENM223S_03773 [Streptomyces tendae]